MTHGTNMAHHITLQNIALTHPHALPTPTHRHPPTNPPKHTMDTAKKAAEDAATMVSDAATTAEEKVSETATTAEKTASDAATTTAKTVSDATTAAVDKVEKATGVDTDKVEEPVKEAEKTVEETVAEAEKTVGETVKQVEKTAKEGCDTVSPAADALVSTYVTRFVVAGPRPRTYPRPDCGVSSTSSNVGRVVVVT